MSVFGVDTFSKTFNASIVADVMGKIKAGANKLLPPNVKPTLPKPEEPKPEESKPEESKPEEEDPVNVDEGTTTEDDTESSSSECGENEEKSNGADSDCVCKTGYGREVGTNDCVELNMSGGGGGGFTDATNESVQGAIGGAISSAIDGFLMKALLGVGVIMGAGYAYENREEIKGYFKSVSKGKVA